MSAMVLLLMTLAIWLVGMLGAFVPLLVASYNKVALAMCNSFAAGVMLAAGFIHLLDDAVRSLSGPSERMNFPLAEFTCGMAFVCVFYIETLFSRRLGMVAHHMTHIRVDRDDACFPPERKADYGAVQIPPEPVGPRNAAAPPALHPHRHDGPEHHHHHHHHHHDDCGPSTLAGDDDSGAEVRLLDASLSPPCGNGHGHNHGPAAAMHDADVHTLGGALCLLAALGFHSVIEGLGLATSPAKQFGIFLAIVCHKGLAALALGSTLLVAHVTRSQFLGTVVAFSLATPLGVGLGLLISAYFKSGSITGACAAIAAGTFIHISAIEIIPSAFKDVHESGPGGSKSRRAPELLQLMSLTVGFSSMALLRLWL